ncbi:hypothetical protein N7493_009127 [Penicillium malachiteum]|uniref:Uncharacterized protein n=1 Tax=Penicillium malachiteum TaxID=1324776 RepID=A0AAD6HGA9_9EURO|nr:hypothetical protein N7493_009127 [Penicillium malachiteum]
MANMISHSAKCDCSHCVPPQELLKSAEVIGAWQTKNDLFTHRIKQELLALKDITSLLATLKSKNPTPPRELDTATKDVLDGIINRRRCRTSVFNVLLDPFASDVAKKAKSDCLAKRNKRKTPCGDLNLDEVEKEITNTLFESATLDKIRETISKNPKGTFHFEYGCATFRYADAEIETPQVDKPVGPNGPVETIDVEEPTGSSKATDNKDDSMAKLNLRIQKLEESLGTSKEDKPTVFDRMEFLEAEFKRLQCAQEEIKRFTSELQEKLDEQPFSPFLNIDLAD